ncbi:MAG: hypothetical protein ACRDCZ_01555, partial [Culicoidibacterales bacterium]
HLNAVISVYEKAAADMKKAVLNIGTTGQPLSIGEQPQLLLQIEQIIKVLKQKRDQVIISGLETSALTAAQYMPLNQQVIQSVAVKAVDFVQNFVAEDGLNLSTRLWRVDQATKETLARTIQTAIINGMDVSNATNAILATPDVISNTLSDAMLANERNPRAQIERLVQTEMQRAYHVAYEESASKAPGVVGFRFNLSPNHRVVDICDERANADLYGLGKGIYPPGKIPIPSHPNSGSYATVVFDDEL